MKRVLIIGSSGAGKTTLAGKLGAAIGIPVVHLDQLYWQPGWREPDKPTWIETVLKPELEKDSWIMDGNFGSSLEMRLAYADTAIFLDLPRTVCIRRVIKRWLKFYGTNRPDMTEGCNEKIDLKFLLWIWNYPKFTRPKIESRVGTFKGKINVITFRSTNEIDAFLHQYSSKESA